MTSRGNNEGTTDEPTEENAMINHQNCDQATGSFSFFICSRISRIQRISSLILVFVALQFFTSERQAWGLAPTYCYKVFDDELYHRRMIRPVANRLASLIENPDVARNPNGYAWQQRRDPKSEPLDTEAVIKKLEELNRIDEKHRTRFALATGIEMISHFSDPRAISQYHDLLRSIGHIAFRSSDISGPRRFIEAVAKMPVLAEFALKDRKFLMDFLELGISRTTRLYQPNMADFRPNIFSVNTILKAIIDQLISHRELQPVQQHFQELIQVANFGIFCRRSLVGSYRHPALYGRYFEEVLESVREEGNGYPVTLLEAARARASREKRQPAVEPNPTSVTQAAVKEALAKLLRPQLLTISDLEAVTRRGPDSFNIQFLAMQAKSMSAQQVQVLKSETQRKADSLIFSESSGPLDTELLFGLITLALYDRHHQTNEFRQLSLNVLQKLPAVAGSTRFARALVTVAYRLSDLEDTLEILGTLLRSPVLISVVKDPDFARDLYHEEDMRDEKGVLVRDEMDQVRRKKEGLLQRLKEMNSQVPFWAVQDIDSLLREVIDFFGNRSTTSNNPKDDAEMAAKYARVAAKFFGPSDSRSPGTAVNSILAQMYGGLADIYTEVAESDSGAFHSSTAMPAK
ncbi:MAG: hypothetical protein C5B49_11715 [Bdellovibrio sp.]|nr:MAG: hypothetical protein C5B49_11715 [Bdellovibrio sp.]